MRLRSQHGIAVPTVVILLTIGFAIASVAAISVQYALRGSVRDEDSKLSLAAAEAGAQQAIWRHNQLETTQTAPCLVQSLSGELVAEPLAAGSQWCDPVQGQTGGVSWTYRTRPQWVTGGSGALVERRLEIVSWASSDNVTRRIETTAGAPVGTNVFGQAGAIGLDQTTLGGNSEVFVDEGVTSAGAGSNNNVELEDSALLCGDALYGYGKGVVTSGSTSFPSSQCPSVTGSESEINLAPPDQGSAWTVNENDRIGVSDPFSGRCATVSAQCWDPVTKTLSLQSNDTLTLGGSLYSLCKLEMQGNSSLIIAGDQTVQIYFGSPDDCLALNPGLDGDNDGKVEQLVTSGNSTIISTSGDPTRAQLLFVGSDSTGSEVLLNGNAQSNNFVLYGPRTDISITGNASYEGAFGGKTLDISGSAKITITKSTEEYQTDVLVRYRGQRFVECTSELPSPSVPDSEC